MKLFLKNQNGQAVLEFAIILPVLMLIIIGIVIVSYMFTAQQVITYAAKEGARIGAQTNQNDQVIAAIEDATKAFDGDLSRYQITIDPEDENSIDRTKGDTLTVELRYTLPFYVEIFSDDYLTVTSVSKSRIEYEEI